MTADIRLGMIGCGQVSERFFEWARVLRGVKFVATCAAHRASAEYAARRYGCPRWYDDYRALLDDRDVDGVVITTPHALHARHALDAVSAGKHVLLEKPMATHWEDATRLVAAAARAGVTFFPLPFLAYPEHLLAQRFLHESIIGKVVAAEAHMSLPGPPRSNWYYRKEAEGGAMLDTMVYALSDLACVLGPASVITGLVNTLVPRRRTGDGGRVRTEVDDNVSLLLAYATGQHATVRSCWAPANFRRATIFYGRHGTIYLREGGKRIVVQSGRGPVPGGHRVEFMGLDDCYEIVPRPIEPEEDILGHFLDSVRTGKPAVSNGALALHVTEQMMKGYESSASRRTIELETDFSLAWDREPGIMDLSGPGYL